MKTSSVVASPGTGRAASVVLVTAAFGLATGMVEALGSLLSQNLRWFYWRALWSLTPETAWVAPATCLLVFGAVGVALAIAGRIAPRFPDFPLAVFVSASLMFYDFLLFSGYARIKEDFLSGAAVAAAAALAFPVAIWLRKSQAKVGGSIRRIAACLAVGTFLATIGIAGWSGMSEKIRTSRLPAPRKPSPNVLLIIVDTLRSDHLSLYGYSRLTDPKLVQIASQGAVFENAISPSSWTLPSHASIMTGTYPNVHGAETGPLDARHATVAEAFRDQGYSTAAFSGNSFFFCRRMGFGRGFIHFEDYSFSPDVLLTNTVFGREVLLRIARRAGAPLPCKKDGAEVSQSFLRWVGQSRSRPFFAVLNYFDVHTPYYPPSSYRNRFRRAGVSAAEEDRTLLRDIGFDGLADPRPLVDGYDGAIRYVDDQIATVLSTLERRRILSDTLVVITSDHGEAFGEHKEFGHGNALYLDTIHVPLILLWRGHIPPGVRVNQPVTTAALPATLLDLAGADGRPAFMGPSLGPYWSSPDHAEPMAPRSYLARLPFDVASPSYRGWTRSVLDSRWHYVVHQTEGEKLYDWRNDPQELDNLLLTPRCPNVLTALREQLGLPSAQR
jgi:arylsulfatase A-like enzyme